MRYYWSAEAFVISRNVAIRRVSRTRVKSFAMLSSKTSKAEEEEMPRRRSGLYEWLALRVASIFPTSERAFESDRTSPPLPRSVKKEEKEKE